MAAYGASYCIIVITYYHTIHELAASKLQDSSAAYRQLYKGVNVHEALAYNCSKQSIDKSPVQLPCSDQMVRAQSCTKKNCAL